MISAIITIRMAPEIHLGPITLAWHGITIAIGLLVAGVVARRWAQRERLDLEPLTALATAIALGGIIGARLFYLLEHDPAAVVSPTQVFSTHGFTFDGGVILGGAFAAAYLHWKKLSWKYLDAAAFAMPIGVAIGRVGDVINGEHYGPASQFLLAVRNAHPEALTPNPAIAYHNGGLYEVILALVVLAIIWPLRHRLTQAPQLGWLVLALFAAGRFFEFFLRADSPDLALGLNNAQWTSIAFLVVCVAGFTVTSARDRSRATPPRIDP